MCCSNMHAFTHQSHSTQSTSAKLVLILHACIAGKAGHSGFPNKAVNAIELANDVPFMHAPTPTIVGVLFLYIPWRCLEQCTTDSRRLPVTPQALSYIQGRFYEDYKKHARYISTTNINMCHASREIDSQISVYIPPIPALIVAITS